MRVSTLFNGFILLVLLVFLAASWNYPFELKFLLWVYIALMAILGGIQILKENSRLSEGEDEAISKLMLREMIANLKGVDRIYLKAIYWVLGFVIFLYFFGFIVSVPLFTIFYMKTHGESWKFSIGLSVVAWGIFFITFIFALHVRLYHGQLYLWLFT
jgi:hypothetical protein